MVFALFCTANVPIDKINRILEEAAEGNGWHQFWLVPADWEPTTRDPSKAPSDPASCDFTTVPPIPTSFVPSFLNKDPLTLIEMLNNSTGQIKMHVNFEYFAVLDAQTVEDGSVLLCEYNEDEPDTEPLRDENPNPSEWKEDLKLETLRAWPRKSSEVLGVLDVKMHIREFQRSAWRAGGILGD